MLRQSHRLRSVDGAFGWFVSRSQVLRPFPPRRELFQDLENGDLFVNWLEGTTDCQVWIFNGSGNGTWTPANWGEQIDGRHLVITPGSSPSLVVPATWLKSYKRKPSRIIFRA